MAVETSLKDDVPGHLIETGIWRGGSCILMKAVLAAYGVTDRGVYVADSFRGLPEADLSDDAADLHDDLTLAVSKEQVRAAFERFCLLDDNVHFIEGWFSDTLPGLRGIPWAVVRLDGDQYGSTMDGIANLYPDLSSGGFLIVDDYHVYESCRRAITEYRTANGITEEIVNIDNIGVFWRKA
jgi:O-methyltransferase